MAPRETENNAYAYFWGEKKRALRYVMVFSGPIVIWVCCKLGNPPFHVIYNYQ